MVWTLWGIGVAAALVAAVCWAFIVAHAFRQSLGAGFMVLCIPCFVFYYALEHFEHRHKGWLVAAFMGMALIAVTFQTLAALHGGALIGAPEPQLGY